MYLLKEGQANISRIARETGLHYRIIRKHAEELKQMGIVSEHVYGRLRFYSVDLTNPKVALIRELLFELERL
jgi:DNA-binding transcriptional ArsR family regulator